MSFAETIRKQQINKICSLKIDKNFIEKNIRCQYNPDRFELWKRIYTFEKERNILYLNYSPHFSFLFWNKAQNMPVQKTRYYNLQLQYGRNSSWITNKIMKFQSLVEDVKENGVMNNPVVLTRPIVKNDYNDRFEIYEGHHRLAIAIFLDIECYIDLCEAVNGK